MTFPRLCAGATLLLASVSSHAFDFKSVGAAPAILYDAPSQRGGKLFVAPRGMPVEVVLGYGDWLKVRDASGALAWTEASGLSSKRNVVVRVDGAALRASADAGAPALLLSDKGVLFELLEAPVAGWVKVKHRDGAVGFIKAAELWGI